MYKFIIDLITSFIILCSWDRASQFYVNKCPTRCNFPTIVTGTNNSWPVPDAVDTVICANDDGWRNHPKHVEQFTDKINCV